MKSLKRPLDLACLFFLLATILSGAAWSQTPLVTPVLSIDSGDAAPEELFGSSVAAAGQLLLVGGAHGDALYLFERDPAAFNWHQILRVTPDDDGLKIGAFTTDGQAIAYMVEDPSGALTSQIRIWRPDSDGVWAEALSTFSLQPSAAQELTLDGDELALIGEPIGASRLLTVLHRVDGQWLRPLNDVELNATHSGFDFRASTFIAGRQLSRRNSLDESFPKPTSVQPEASMTAEASAVFGNSVALSEDGRWLAMGASLDSIDGEHSGSVYLFNISSVDAPVPHVRLAPSDAGPGRFFGASVHFEGQRLAVTAPGSSDDATLPRTYIFEDLGRGRFAEMLRLDTGRAHLALAGDVAFAGDPSSPGGPVLVYSLTATEDLPPQVSLAPVPYCSHSASLDIAGEVSSSGALHRVFATVDSGPEQDLCFRCGHTTIFQWPVDLSRCQESHITVTAEDATGRVGSSQIPVYFDDDDPVLKGCEDQNLEPLEGETLTKAQTPTATDGCGEVEVSCSNLTDSGWPNFPIGPDQPATCTAVDLCGRWTSCQFHVTVEGEEPPTEETTYDFSMVATDVLSALSPKVEGEGSGSALIENGKLLMSHLTASPQDANQGQLSSITASQTSSSKTRVEIETPRPVPTGAKGLAGVSILASGVSKDAAMGRISTDGHQVFFQGRTEPGGPIVDLAPPLTAEGVTDFAIEREGQDLRLSFSKDGGQTWSQREGAEFTMPQANFNPSKVSLFVASLGESAQASTSALRGPLQKSTNEAIFSFGYLRLGPPEGPSERQPDCQKDDFADGSLDPAWTLTGVGNANQQSLLETGDELRLSADGATAFFGADNAGFLYREITGDFRMETTIDGNPMTRGGQYRKAGLMVRQSLDPWDIRLLAQLVPFWENTDTAHLQFVARESYGTPGRLPVSRDVIGVPRVVRLAVIREGQTLAVEFSLDDGATWIRPSTGLGGSITIDGLAPTLLVGLDMVSNNISVTSTAHFDDFLLCQPRP